MNVKVWGCRGSLTTPGAHTLRHGGNTTCIEVRSRDSTVIIIDAGSGARNLGKSILQQKDIKEFTWLFTHAHLDHLNGFPFFDPAYLAGYRLTICGGAAPQASMRRFLARQMEAPFFPVDFKHLNAHMEFGCQCGTESCKGVAPGSTGSLQCSSISLNHPNGGVGFRLTEAGKSFVFLTDNELDVMHPGGLPRSAYVKFCTGADLLFHDAQYTDEEYTRRRGWGHTTYNSAVRLALEAGVKRLGLFHHDPDRTDDDLDVQVQICKDKIAAAGGNLDCFACVEGMEIEV